MFSTTGGAQVPLEIFGGLVTEQSPMTLPLGVSPDCLDMAFKPGSVTTRPALKKVIPAGFGSNTTTYAKSFVDNKGVVRNLFLDSSGAMWVEDVTNNPGIATQVASVTPGSYAKSITALGREYIAISDGLSGTDVPLQFDGTNFDRVTQDGPGTPPVVSSIIIPATTMAAAGGPPALVIAEIDPDQRAPYTGNFTVANIYVTGGSTLATVGSQITIAGTGSVWDGGPYTVITNPGPGGAIVISFVTSPTQTGYHGSGTLTVGTAGVTMTRASNVVSVATTTDHGLQVGYLAQISGVPAAPVGGNISQIVINNEDSPGLATITTTDPHGLVPGASVSINGVLAVDVGAGITSISRQGGIVTVITSSPHGLVPGNVFTISSVSDTSFNTSAVVAEVLSPTGFAWFQPLDASNALVTGSGTIAVNWPVPQTAEPYYYSVQSAPTPTTFQVSISYGDATWTGASVASATVSYAWDGTFFVKSVPSSTTFTYQQYGPDATSSVAGTVTPFGQASPGQHQVRISFLTRQGFITEPSPPALFEANGGQYLSVTNIAIGPPNVVARILQFTGASGAYFFYIPQPGEVNGQIVSTATQLNDNTTTSTVLDFSDNTLFSSLGVSIPGNNVAAQIVLDSALGFAFYAERLVTYGQRNTIQNLLNMGFDGGSILGQITGWKGTGTLAPGHFSTGVTAPSLSQSFYQDALGLPIAQPNTKYIARAWLSSGSATVSVTSASTGFSSVASLTAGIGGWAEAAFTTAMPAVIPPDMTLTLSSGATVDNLSIIYADVPFLNKTMYGSYVDNPEAFDGSSGAFGVDDVRKIMTVGIIRDTLFALTQEPAGRLHAIPSNGVTEPAGWVSSEVAGNCGAMSTFALTVSQADDATAGGGEEWMAWMSYAGARIFSGNEPNKISQEIQPNWDSINIDAWQTVWAMNDPSSRRVYFGLPLGTLADGVSLASAPTFVYHMDYKNLGTAQEIAEAAPVHLTLTGKLVARDNARKWCPWSIKANGAALIYRAAGGPLYTVFFGGNGAFPGTVMGGCGNVFTLCDNQLTDDCQGQISPYYVTAAFASPDVEEAMQLGGQRHLLQYLQWEASGTGRLIVSPLVNTLSNAWPITVTVALRSDPAYDDEWGAGQASGQRFFLKFSVLPV